jgi:UDP-N-acetyl-D-glucosamine dehydrogenase
MNKQKKTVGVIGLGYVGLPLLINFNKFFDVIGFDSNSEKVIKINEGISEINHISSSDIQNIQSIYPRATSDYSFIEKVDAIIICVPTPITKHREPDLTFVKTVMEDIGPFLQKGQLISLESTTYPGTTEEIIYGKLKQLGFEAGLDIFVTYSPEREDPGSKYLLEDIPKVIGGLTPACSKIGISFYSLVFKQVVEVSSVKVAELSKLLENIHRAVNIGMINEFKIICDSMNIDPFEVIEAAATKPFGFVPYYPGPGWGGHCIPVDPFYLSWKVKEFDQTSRFIELAGELNQITQKWVISKISSSLNEKGVALSKSRILLLGLAYKPNVDDARESPSLYIFSELLKTGACVDYSDPFFKTFPKTRKYNLTSDSVDINAANLASYDAVIMLTNHEAFNLPLIHNHAKLIIDTRGVFKPDGTKVIRA